MKNFILVLFLASSVLVSAQKKPASSAPVAQGKLTGVVIYESKAGTKPDIATEVVIHRSEIKENSAQDTISRFLNIKLLKKVYTLTNEDEYLKKLKEANADTPEKFTAIDKATINYFFLTMKNPESIVAMVNANGNYTADLKPGRYEVIFRSHGSPDVNSITEVNGQIDHCYVVIKPGETKIYNQKFE